MNINIEASPFIDTKNSEKAKKNLYNIPFEVSLIANRVGIKPQKLGGFWESDEAYQSRLKSWEIEDKKVLFENWICKDMHHYQEIRYTEKDIIITFETNEYVVDYSRRRFIFPLLPDTLDDFINDMKRIGIILFWKAKIADIYGIENITSNKKIIDYYSLIKDINGSSTKKWE